MSDTPAASKQFMSQVFEQFVAIQAELDPEDMKILPP